MATSVLRRAQARWAVPVGVAALVGAAVAVPIVADADPTLPERSAAELLASLSAAEPVPFAGTVVQSADFGFPELPSSGGSGRLLSLVTGSNTARVWYASPEQFRFALMEPLSETDIIRNGSDLWVWSSDDNTVQQVELPPMARGAEPEVPRPALPAELAQEVLDRVDRTTEVLVDGSRSVAGRDAYELVIRPRDEKTLIGEIRLAIDAEHSLPLRVQLLADGATEPAIELGFTSVSFETPPDSVFDFNPPPGAELGTGEQDGNGDAGMHGDLPHSLSQLMPTVVGEGWSSVVVLHGIDVGQLTAASGEAGEGAAVLDALLGSLRPAEGGRAFTTSLFSVLILDDGRVLAGAVPVDVLTDAAEDPAAAGAGGFRR